MNLELLRKKQHECLLWKNIAPVYKQLLKVQSIRLNHDPMIEFSDVITIGDRNDLNDKDYEAVVTLLKMLIPWRKGPFNLFGLQIESEWRSFIKYNIIKPHFNLKDKVVADIGCNNGYYMFKMSEEKPKKLVGFDPSAWSMLQFNCMNHFIQKDITYEMFGVEYLELYEHRFDFIFMLGVLYHRLDPIGTLKILNRSLNQDGEVLIDTFIIDGEEPIALTPLDRYAKMPNVYFIPTINTLKGWLNRAGFTDINVLDVMFTSCSEQSKTDWTYSESLEEFLDPNDHTKTIEGYPAPKRAYIKASKR